MMLDWLADKHGLEGAAEAGERIERAVDKAYADGIKPMEFGGSNGTADITKAVLAALWPLEPASSFAAIAGDTNDALRLQLFDRVRHRSPAIARSRHCARRDPASRSGSITIKARDLAGLRDQVDVAKPRMRDGSA